MKPANGVEVYHLTVRYGQFSAVKNLTFTIPAGECFGFIGPNGAGKSTTIRVLATLQAPTSGQARIGGYDVVRQAGTVRRLIGYMPDSFGLYDDLNVEEYLYFFAAAYRLAPARRDGVVADVLALTDLGHKRQDPVDGLSRGMKQRLGIARVLLHDPEVLLLDEPASGLDPRAMIEMRELIKALRGMGKTILISSHILQELSHLCTRIGIIEAGALVAEGSLAEIFARLDLQRQVHVQMVEEPAGLLERLGAIPGVAKVDRDVDRLSIHLREDTLPVEGLHDHLVRLGCRLRMFQPQALDMETAFMKLTVGQTR